MHDSGVGKYLALDPLASPLSGSGSMGKYLPAREASKPQTANQSVFGKATGGIGRYVQDGKH